MLDNLPRVIGRELVVRRSSLGWLSMMDGEIGNVLDGDFVASWSRLDKKAKAA